MERCCWHNWRWDLVSPRKPFLKCVCCGRVARTRNGEVALKTLGTDCPCFERKEA